MSDLRDLLERIVPASGGSERQRRDIAGILATLGDSLDRSYLHHWLRELELEAEWALAQQTPLA